MSNLSAPKADYPGPANFWKLSFEDGATEEDGYLVVLPDSRIYAWLPESDETRLADGTYDSDSGRLEASGVVYESGRIEVAGGGIEGGSEPFELSATYRQGDWITGSYTVGGVERDVSMAGPSPASTAAPMPRRWRAVGNHRKRSGVYRRRGRRVQR